MAPGKCARRRQWFRERVATLSDCVASANNDVLAARSDQSRPAASECWTEGASRLTRAQQAQLPKALSPLNPTKHTATFLKHPEGSRDGDILGLGDERSYRGECFREKFPTLH